MRGRVGKLVTSVFVAGFVFTGFTNSSVLADEQEFSTVYHVYVEDEHAGIVEDKDTIENYKKEIIGKHQEDNDFSYTIDKEISYVSEKVFSSKADKQEVLDYLEEELTVSVEAKALMVGDKLVGYFADEEAAEEVIQSYKTEYVEEEVLEQLEKSEGDPAEALTERDTVITDVSLTEEIAFKEAEVKEDNILTAEEGLTLLKKGTLEDKTHTVEEGDVLGAIAAQYDLSTDKLLELNPGFTEDSLLQIGDQLHVTAYEPFLEVVVTEESLKEEEISYETEIKESEEMYKGEKETTQEGENGKVEKHYQIKKVNGSTIEKEVVAETILKEPTKEIIVKGTKVISSRGTGDFVWPAVGGYISSHLGERWGRMHKGIDIAGVSDRSILAADNGTVVSAGWDDGGYGNKIVINHNNGYRTIYAHLDSIDVSSGQVVEKGMKIGVMGTTGRSTGIHLHFEVYKDGSLKNPADLVK